MNEHALEISLVNDLRELAGVAEQIDHYCELRNIEAQIAYAVNLSVDEILTNTISYGYEDDKTHRIELLVRRENGALVVVIVDDSVAFDVTATTQPELDAPLSERIPGGLGLFLVHQMMDDVKYRRQDGRNIVTLTKSVSPDSGAAAA